MTNPIEVTFVSGKGGTGKTTLMASIATLSGEPVLADCDVDAPDLNLVLEPEILHEESFSGGKTAVIDQEKCLLCGKCAAVCRFQAVVFCQDDSGAPVYKVSEKDCEGCAVCARFCPAEAVSMIDRLDGNQFVSETRLGPMAHAKLNPAAETSGKLVTQVRKTASRMAEQTGRSPILIDGSPGIGCPVIASLAGTDWAVIVVEPTASGFSDARRIAQTASHFNTHCAICINEYDINPEITDEIRQWAASEGIPILGRIPFDTAAVDAIFQHKTLVEMGETPAAASIRIVWKRLESLIATKQQEIINLDYCSSRI